MALEPLTPTITTPKPKVNNQKDIFEDRLRKLKESLPSIKTKIHKSGKYRIWKLMCSYIWIRTYDNKITIHVAGNIDHYEMKEMKYGDVNCDCSDVEFIQQILTDKIDE